jgi:hypothetical protein
MSAQDVALGEDAGQLAAVEHEHGADVLGDHPLGDLRQRQVGLDREQLGRHVVPGHGHGPRSYATASAVWAPSGERAPARRDTIAAGVRLWWTCAGFGAAGGPAGGPAARAGGAPKLEPAATRAATATAVGRRRR